MFTYVMVHSSQFNLLEKLSFSTAGFLLWYICSCIIQLLFVLADRLCAC